MIQLETEGRTITFNKEQEEATDGILSWYLRTKEDFFLLAGYAGTGKTTITKHIIRWLRDNGGNGITFANTIRVCVCAPTHKAKKVIEKATGLPGHTLQRLLGLSPDINVEEFDPNKPEFKPKKPAIIGDYDLVILDEASMVNRELFKFIVTALDKSGHNTKILILADPAQLPPIKERLSPIFDSPLISSKYLLTMVERQADDNPILAILDTIRNDTSVAYDGFEHIDVLSPDGDGILFLNTLDFTNEVKKQFVSESYYSDPDYCKVLCWTNAMAAVWNNGIRKAKMEVLHPGKSVEYLYPVMEGDVLMAHSGYEGKIQNSTDYFVTKSERSSIDIRYPAKGTDALIRVRTYATTLRNVDTGGQVFTHVLDQSDAQNIANYMKAYWAYINQAKKLTSAWRQYFDFRSWIMILKPIDTSADGKFSTGKDLDYGYAITIHKSQGSSYTNVFVDGMDISKNRDNHERNKLKYVALSRMRKMAYYRIS